MNVAYNMDCLTAMREMPDNAFDLAVVDPPYGDGSLQTVQVERERAGHGITVSEAQDHDLKSTSVARTGGKWAAKYGKK